MTGITKISDSTIEKTKKRNSRRELKMKKMIAIIVAMFMMISLTACGAADNAGTQKEITDVAVYEDTQANILSADFYDLEDGTPVVRVHFKFANMHFKMILSLTILQM